MAVGLARSNVTVPSASPARLRASAIRHGAVSTRAIAVLPSASAQTAMWRASRAKEIPRTRPLNVRVKRNALARPHRGNRHGLRGAVDICPREKPAREQVLRKRNGRCVPAGYSDDLEPVGKACARPAVLLRHPCEGEAGLCESTPEWSFPIAVALVVDGLRIAEIRKNLRRRLGYNILALNHESHLACVMADLPMVGQAARVGKRGAHRGKRSFAGRAPCGAYCAVLPG
jgi:hypothetical protein